MPKVGSIYKKYLYDNKCTMPRSTYYYRRKMSKKIENEKCSNDILVLNTSVNNSSECQVYFVHKAE